MARTSIRNQRPARSFGMPVGVCELVPTAVSWLGADLTQYPLSGNAKRNLGQSAHTPVGAPST